MKKLLIALIAAGTLTLAACGNPAATSSEEPASSIAPASSEPAPAPASSEEPEPEPEPERCTEHEDGYVGWFLTGPNSITVNGVRASENKGKEWDFGGDSFELKPTELADIEAIDKGVFDALTAKGKEVTGIYTLSGVGMGLDNVGWSQNFKDGDKIYKANASYVAKIIKTKYNGEDDAWATQAWTPDPKTAHVENLKNYWTPTFQEEADEYGFAWNQNPVVTAGAGIYTVIFATYTGGASLEHCNYGCAFVKTTELPVKYEELQPWVADAHTYGIIGLVDWNADSAQLEKVDGVYTAEVVIDAEHTQFKVRADGKWDDSWGYAALDEDSKALANPENGNIEPLEAGTYVVKMHFGTFAFETSVSLTKKVPNEEAE